MENSRIVESLVLPSKGLIYEEEINPELQLSSMKTKHEMLRLSATEETQKVMAEIIDDCIQTDIGISSYDLCLGDFQFLLYKLRTVTFGPEYQLSCICPYCGFENMVTLNLDELPVKEYTDDLGDLLEFELPITEQRVKITMQTPRMLDRINSRVREHNKRRTGVTENATLLYTIMACIEEIDGEPVDLTRMESWIRELPMADTNTILYRINLVNESIGIDLDSTATCRVCGSTFVAPFRVNDTFFRPHITI